MMQELLALERGLQAATQILRTVSSFPLGLELQAHGSDVCSIISGPCGCLARRGRGEDTEEEGGRRGVQNDSPIHQTHQEISFQITL